MMIVMHQPLSWMTRRNVLHGGVAMLGAAAGLPHAQSETAAALPAVGTVLKLPDVKLLQGGRLSAADMQGKLVVVYWWASWCPFCMIQSPHIQKLWQAHAARGLQVLGLSIDRREADAKTYLDKKAYTFPSAMFTPEVTQVLAKPKGLPVVIVRGRDGRVKHAEAGEMFPEDIEKFAQWL
jgi:thiol-disulfide isomerase/thioredoxin